ncbi:MAG: hypothetical protein ACKVKF_18820, partial [Rhodobacterales bacterium]
NSNPESRSRWIKVGGNVTGSWRYEREWRLIGTRGLQDSPLELEEVVFGIRCGSALKYTIFKALEDRRRPIKFYEIQEQRGDFTLRKCEIDFGESRAYFPLRARDYIDAFTPIIEALPPIDIAKLPLQNS